MARQTGHLESRRRRFDKIAARLAAQSDGELAAGLAAGRGAWLASVHGGQSGAMAVEGETVFVKMIGLTAGEQEHEDSTANLFNLPLFYQYGVGSAGFGAWRELKAQLSASEWALSGACPFFPLVYHWRVLPRTAPLPLNERQRAWLDRAVAYWDHSEAIGARLAALTNAPAAIVIFLEHAPATLASWLRDEWPGGRPSGAAEAAILHFYEQLREAAAFMNASGMLHFDLHTHNVLTDGTQIYAADYGLALCADFDLSPEERAFFDAHRYYDRCYIDWTLREWLGLETEPARELTPRLKRLVERCGPVADVFGTFIGALRESKTIAYPSAALEAALSAAER